MSEKHSTVRAVGYWRASTDRQEASIPEQKDWARRACRAHRVELVAEFQDDGIPGSEIERRTGLMELLDTCERQAAAGRPVEAIVCWDADRFSRASSLRTAGLICRLLDAGVTRMLTAEGWIDWEDDTDLLVFNVKQDTGKAGYSKSISKNATRSALERAQKGLWVAARPPYGYVKGPDGHLDLGAPARADAVRWIFPHFAATADSLADVARRLHDRGVPPPEPRRRRQGPHAGELWGGRWTRHAVADILHNRAYLGEIVWNATSTAKYHRVQGGEVRQRKGKKGRVVNAAEDRIVIPDAHPPLVDPETFAACQRKLEATCPPRGPDGERVNKCRNTPAAGGGEWVLSGLLYCGDCKGRMGGVTTWKRRGAKVYTYRRYVCRATMRHGRGACRRNPVLQETVLEETARLIRESFTDPKRRQALEAEVRALAREQDGNAAADRERLRRRVEELGRQIDRGNDNLARLPADLVDDVAARVRGWKEERRQAEQELARLETAAESGTRFADRVGKALEEIQALEKVILEAPPDRVRDALAGLAERITLHFDHGPPMKDGRRRAYLRSVEVALVPEVAHLFGCDLLLSGSRRR
jgi:DNA invertase Pin-like site-specific DNA recombinase